MEQRTALTLLVESILAGVQKKISMAGFDRTSIGHVIRDNGNRTYDVNAFGKVYTLPYDGTLKMYQMVRVRAPQNDFNNLYIENVAGSYKEPTEEVQLPETLYSNRVPNGMADSDFNDISATAPVLESGGYLYITEGYNQNQKISLAQLVPDDASLVGGPSDFVVSGQTAYDNDGMLVTGNLDANSQSGSLVDDESKVSGHSVYRVTTTKGHNRDAVRTTDIPVYQGELNKES